jgi:carboxylesterase type B
MESITMLGIALFSFYLIVACLIVYWLRMPHSQKWWIKIITQSPACTYYFGPFDSRQEAQVNQNDYLQDLQAEAAQVTSTQILQQSPPQQLTVCEDESEFSGVRAY